MIFGVARLWHQSARVSFFALPTYLAAVAISAELAQLQQLAETLGDAERTVLNRHLNAISSLCADVQLSVIRTVFALATVDEGMEGLLDPFATRGRR